MNDGRIWVAPRLLLLVEAQSGQLGTGTCTDGGTLDQGS